jgi:uncharacterized membrane protein
VPEARLTEERIKHLEFIQAAISRMAGNSALLKGWSVTIAAALLALAAKEASLRFAVLALFPAASFWILDAFYLRLERLFRSLYDDVRLLSEEEYKKKVGAFSMQVKPYEGTVDSWFALMWSDSVFWLHGIVCLSAISTILIVNYLK